MKKSSAAVLLAIILLGPGFSPPASGAAAERRLLVEVALQRPGDLERLQQLGLDIAAQVKPKRLHLIVSAAELEALRGSGWSVRVLHEDLVARFAQTINADEALGNYHTYAEMLAAMQQIAAAYPDLARLIDIGDSWEKTQGLGDRDLWALKISDQPDQDDSNEADVLIMGCHHARELITVEIPLAVAAYLTDHYASDQAIRTLVNEREIWIVPMVNPDGHVYVETTDPMWRKNRNDNGFSDPRRQGVDLNRNYGYRWGYDVKGSSPLPTSETYRGSGPFSEPETQAVRDLVAAHNFTFSLSYHSYGNLFLFPWGYRAADTPDDDLFNLLGRIYTRSNGYAYGNVKDGLIYVTNGDSDDWLYGEQIGKNKVFGVTVEVGEEFQPPSDQVPALISENLPSALIMIFLAGLLNP